MWVEFTMFYSLPNVHACCFLFYKYGDAVTFFQSDNHISNNFNDHYNGFIQILLIRSKQFLKLGQLANSLTGFFITLFFISIEKGLVGLRVNSKSASFITGPRNETATS